MDLKAGICACGGTVYQRTDGTVSCDTCDPTEPEELARIRAAGLDYDDLYDSSPY